MAKQYIGIKRVWYANPIASITGASLSGAEIKALIDNILKRSRAYVFLCCQYLQVEVHVSWFFKYTINL